MGIVFRIVIGNLKLYKLNMRALNFHLIEIIKALSIIRANMGSAIEAILIY